MAETKKRFGDRKDARLLRELDSLHFITGIIYPNRCDNEAYISEHVDLGPINEYIARKNEEAADFPYTFFHLVMTALVKTITLRPKLNRFIANSNFYQRNEVSASFIVKKKFDDRSEEGLAFLHVKPEDTLESIHEELRRQITDVRTDHATSTDDSMDLFNKMPRWLGKFLVHIIMWLDKHGWVPTPLIAADPYYSSVVISNLGSIKLRCGYHHLTNWGTCSLFCVIGEKRKVNELNDDGSVIQREILDLGLTIDERLADGYYYSKSIRLLKHLLAHPEELEKPVSEEVDYE